MCDPARLGLQEIRTVVRLSHGQDSFQMAEYTQVAYVHIHIHIRNCAGSVLSWLAMLLLQSPYIVSVESAIKTWLNAFGPQTWGLMLESKDPNRGPQKHTLKVGLNSSS